MSADKLCAGLHRLDIETHARVEFRDVTRQVQQVIIESGMESGMCVLFVPHTTAAVLVNENYDSELPRDFNEFLRTLAPRDRTYHHDDGNADAHLKAAVIGASKTLVVESSRLVLGTWQGVFLCEFDGPRQRRLLVKLVAG